MSSEYRPELTDQIEREKRGEEITIRNIDVALTKVNIQPGDALLVSAPNIRSKDELERIRHAFTEAFGCPTFVLSNGLKLEAILTIAPKCLELAEAERANRAEEHRAAIQKVLGNADQAP